MSTHSKPQNEEVKYQLCEHQDCLKFWTPTIGYWSECRYPETVKLPGVLYEDEVLKRINEVLTCIGMVRDNIKERFNSRKQIDWMNKQKLFLASEKWKKNEGPGTNKLKEILSKVNFIDLHVKHYNKFQSTIEKEKRERAKELNDAWKNQFPRNNHAQRRKRKDDWQNNSYAPKKKRNDDRQSYSKTQTWSKRKKNEIGKGYSNSFSEKENDNFNKRRRSYQDTSSTSPNKRLKLGNDI